MEMQNILMKFDPATGEERPYPSHAAQWREWHGGTAWLFDPWTGKRRNAYDVGSDVHGLLIVPAGTLGGDTGCGASKQNKHEAGNDAQRPEPVGWMTPGGDISRSLRWCTERCLPNDFRLEALYTRAQVEAMVCAQRPSTPVGWSDTDWINHLQEQEGQHPLKWLHINQGSLDAAADAYEAEYNEAQEARRAERDAEKRRAARRNDGRD